MHRNKLYGSRFMQRSCVMHERRLVGVFADFMENMLGLFSLILRLLPCANGCVA